MRSAPLFIFLLFLSACCPKIVQTGEETLVTEVEHVVPLPPVSVIDSARVVAEKDWLLEILNSGGSGTKETKSGGVKVVLRVDSSGIVSCQGVVDSLLRENDSLRVQLPETTKVKTYVRTEYKARPFDIALRWVCLVLLLLLAYLLRVVTR